MGWYYYLDDKIQFPFQARRIASKVVSPLKKGETVEVQRMAPEEACENEMLVLIRWQRRSLAIRWVCRVLGVFANEACELARSGPPT